MKTHKLDSDSEDNVKLSINRYLLDEFGLNIGIHKDIREYILLNTHIEKIVFLNRIFKNVLSFDNNI